MKKILLLWVCAALLSVVLASCSYEIPELSREEVEAIALSYFADVHGKGAEVSHWCRKQVLEDVSVWCIHVTIDGESYELMLDEKDAPLADNYLCLNLIREVDAAVFYQWPDNCSVSFSAYLDYDEGEYKTYCQAITRQLPEREQSGEYFAFLQLLKQYSIDRLSISVSSPDFLRPDPERNLGDRGYQLSAGIFSTDILEGDFENKYFELVDSTWWDEEIFVGLKQQLVSLGYQNVDLFISEYKVDSIVIEVYCELGTAETAQNENAAVREVRAIPGDAFRVAGKSISYRLNILK